MKRIHEKSPYRIYVSPRFLLVAFVLVGIVSVPIAGTKKAEADKERIACKEYASREVAQALFDANPKKYKRLDHDGDKKVCE